MTSNCAARPLSRLAGLCLAAAAQAAAAGQWAGSAGLLSDKVVYGLSQSGGDPAAVLDLAWRGDTGWSLAAGAASLGRGAHRPDTELSLGVGVGGAISEAGDWQLSATRYETTGNASERRPGYNQLALGYAWRERLQLAVLSTGAFSLPAPGGGRVAVRAFIAQASWHQPLARRWALDAGIGRVHYRSDVLHDFNYGSLGASWGLGPVQLYATRVFSNSPSPTAAGSRVVLSLLWNF